MQYELDIEAAQKFIQSGRALFTLQNKDTNRRYTYRVTTDLKKSNSPFFIKVLVHDSEMYQYIGYVKRSAMDTFIHGGSKTTISETAGSVIYAKWLYKHLFGPNPSLRNAIFWHHGRCAKCGRDLTDPESIKLGLGPICRGL